MKHFKKRYFVRGNFSFYLTTGLNCLLAVQRWSNLLSHGSFHFPLHFSTLLIWNILLWCGLKYPGSKDVCPEHERDPGGNEEKQEPQPVGHQAQDLCYACQDDQVLKIQQFWTFRLIIFPTLIEIPALVS